MHIEGDDDENVTDQNSLSTEEQALEDKMRQDGDGNEEDDGKPAPVAAKPAKPKKAAVEDDRFSKDFGKTKPAVTKPEGEEELEEEVDGGEGAAGAEGADGKGGKKKDMVPHSAMHEERVARKAAEAELVKERETHAATMAKAMERFEKTLQAFAPKPPEVKVEPVPDFETDPAGWISHTMISQNKTLEEVQGELKTLKTEKAQQAETVKHQGAVKEIFDYAVTKENEFKAATPDYDDASKFLLEGRKAELGVMYNEKQVAEMINIERLTIAHLAKEQGKNPAEIVYNIAKTRGYAKIAPVVEEEEEDDGGKQPTAEESRKRLAAAKKGAEGSASLSNARGNAPSPLTAQRLLEMPEAEFDRMVNTPEGRALMGS